jgi:hypothetical protein
MHGLKRLPDGLGRYGAFTLLLASLTMLAVSSSGPSAASPQQCPNLTVTGPESEQAGQRLVYNASPNVGREFRWRVNAGRIDSGQGTAEIVVVGVTTRSVKVSVENPGCNNVVSALTQINAPLRFDEYGNIRFNDEKARLDNFAIELQNEPASQAYLLCYSGRRGRTGEAQRRCDRVKNYLVNTRGISADRIQTVDGGYREELTVELWIVPPGAAPPQATPTVDPSEVKPARRSRRP